MASWLPKFFQNALPRVKPFDEMGVSGTPVYAGIILSPERSPKLLGQEKYRTFSDILANTSIVAAGVRYFLNVIARPSWSAEPADDSKDAEAAAEFVNTVLFDDLHTPWVRIVRRAGMYRFYGFSMQEWTATRRDDGRIGFHDIEARPQWTIWRWEVDERGTVVGAWQRDPMTGRELGLPRGKLMYLVDDTLSDSPEGTGLLRHIYEPAERLKEYLDQEAIGFLRDLRGVPIGYAPLDMLDQMVNSKKLSEPQKKQMLDNFLSFITLEKKSHKTAMLLDSQMYKDYTDSGVTVARAPLWKAELMSGQAPGLSDVNTAVVRINQEIARILGVEHLLLGTDAAGSYALAKEKATDLYTLANSVLHDIRDQVQHDLVWPLWALNGWKDELMPTLKTEDVAPKDVEQIARVLQMMAAAGSVLQPDDEVQNFVRDALGAPHIDLEAIMEMERQQQALEVNTSADQQGQAGAGQPVAKGDDVDKMVSYTEAKPKRKRDEFIPPGLDLLEMHADDVVDPRADLQDSGPGKELERPGLNGGRRTRKYDESEDKLVD